MYPCFYKSLGCQNQVEVKYDVCSDCFESELRDEDRPAHWQKPNGARPICLGCGLMDVCECEPRTVE